MALILVLLFIISPAIISNVEVAEAFSLIPETRVQITNGLESKSSLHIHCKDKHHDLGTHAVPYSQTYEFKIKVRDIWVRRTLYFCGFVWGNRLHWFDTYVKSRDQPTCNTHCRWVIKDAGPCLLGTYPGDRCFPWNKN